MDFGQLAPPPASPELPENAFRWPQWPWWFAIAGFLVAIVLTLLLVGVFALIFGIDSGDSSSGFIIGATVAQSVIFVGTAFAFARTVQRPRAWHFSLRATPLWPGVGWAALGLFAFYVVAFVYGVLVQPDAEQNVVQELGGDSGTAGVIAAGVMVIMVAPFAEELFFRGFFYRSLRTKLPIAAAAALNGLLFGIVHWSGGVQELLLIIPLGILGAIFCLVLEKTGSLFPVIGMHAVNNSIAYAAQGGDGAWIVSLVAGPIVLLACVLIPRALPRTPRPAPA